MSAEVLTMPPTAPAFERLTIDREAFRRLCLEAAAARGVMQACATTLGAQGPALATIQRVDAALGAAVDAALVTARPA